MAVLMIALSLVMMSGTTASAEEIYICHATGDTKFPKVQALEDVKGFVVNSPSDSGDVSGHVGEDHQDGWDIIPPVPSLGFAGQNWTAYGEEVYYAGCKVPVNDAVASVSITPATCQSGAVLVLNTPTFASWGSVTGTSTGPGSYSVTATADSGHRFSDGLQTKTFTGSLAGPIDSNTDNCAARDAVASVSITPDSCQSGAVLVLNTPTFASWGSVTGTSTGPGSYSVTATADSGHRFANGDRTKTFSGSLAGPIDSTTDACAARDATATVSITPESCQSGAVLVLGTPTFASWGSVTGTSTGPGSYSVTATADSGHRFANGETTKTITGTLAGPLASPSEDCPVNDATAVLGTNGAPTCQAGETLELGPISNATWDTPTRTEGPGAFSVTATADSGHRFANGETTKTITGTLAGPMDADDDQCAVEDATAAVSITPPTCQSGAVLVLGDAVHASWGSITGGTGPSTYSVTATADSGHRFANSSRSQTFSGPLAGPFDADDDQCAARDAAAVVSTVAATCQAGETLVYGSIANAVFSGTPDGTQGPGNFSVIATADFGHRFSNGARTKTLSGTLAGPLDPDSDHCAGKDAAAQISTTPPSCGVGERLVLGNVLHAAWGLPTLSEGPGQYSVTATADSNYRFADGQKTKIFTGSLAGPLADNNGPNFPGCDRPEQPQPTKRQVSGSAAGCDLQVVGGVATWTDEWTTSYVWSDITGWTGVETGPVRVAEDFTAYTDDEYFAECAPSQPEDLVLEVAGVQAGCDIQGMLTWVDVYTTASVWNHETRAWKLGDQTGPVRTNEVYVSYSADQFEEECVEEPEVKGEQAQVMHHQLPADVELEVELKGEQAVVPTAVDAGIGIEESPLGSGRNPLCLLAVGGGLGLMGSAGWRRRAANR